MSVLSRYLLASVFAALVVAVFSFTMNEMMKPQDIPPKSVNVSLAPANCETHSDVEPSLFDRQDLRSCSTSSDCELFWGVCGFAINKRVAAEIIPELNSRAERRQKLGCPIVIVEPVGCHPRHIAMCEEGVCVSVPFEGKPDDPEWLESNDI